MRYRVHYKQDSACTEEDFWICSADSEAEAEEVFHQYHPDTLVLYVEELGLRALAANADEHEFLMSLLDAIDDEGLESRLFYRLYEG